MKLLKETYRWITFLIIAAILAILISVAHVFFLEQNFSSLRQPYSSSIFTSLKSGELLSGNVIRGEFKTKENNLGIVSIRFTTFNRINYDELIFRIKEKGEKKWYYLNKYKSKEFGGYDLFPFGFPIINNSKGKSYIFELESLGGKPKNAVAIDSAEPSVRTTHKFSRGELLSDNKLLIQFLLKKIVLAVNSLDINLLISVYSLLVFLFILPRLTRVILLNIKRNFHKQKSHAVTRIKLSKKNIYLVLHNVKLWMVILNSKIMIFSKLLINIYKYIIKKLFYVHRYLAEDDWKKYD